MPRPAAAGPASAAAARQVRPREARQERMSQAFSQVVAVLMRRPQLPHRLADLEWLVLPPLMAGQWKLGQTTAPKGAGQATARRRAHSRCDGALGARVAAIDKRLSANLDKPVDLRPNEWASGDIVWMMAHRAGISEAAGRHGLQGSTGQNARAWWRRLIDGQDAALGHIVTFASAGRCNGTRQSPHGDHGTL